MTVCEMLVMPWLNSVSGPKPACLQQVTVHFDLESLKPVRSMLAQSPGQKAEERSRP